MRPTILNSLFQDISVLSGVGKQRRDSLVRLAGFRVYDLASHLPVSVVDRRYMPDLMSAPDGMNITAIVEIDEHLPPPPRSKRPFKIVCSNETGYLTIIYFNVNENYIVREFPVGEVRVVNGKVDRFDGMLQMPHPDYVMKVEDLDKILKLTPVYPLTYGITQRTIHNVISQTVKLIPDLSEWIDNDFLDQQKWISWKKSLERIHNPEHKDDLLISSPYRKRLAYDELLANQLALALSRIAVKKRGGREINGDGVLREKVTKTLPFILTNSQQNVLKEILDDMSANKRMVRLLQGDVGSGKTVVALMAILNAVESGCQAAFMAPTEILSIQHMEWISTAIKNANLDIKVELLTGRIKGKKRKEILEKLESGEINIIIGTHALFQENVKFHDLSLVIIDEQQRFGVRQRLSLSGKGVKTDILLMTATPIPRTLSLTLYGDLDISTLTEKPAGRIPIDTRIMPLSRIPAITEGIRRAIEKGERVYWVCPLIEESEDTPIAAVEERFKELRRSFGNRVGLVHGRMKGEEKDEVMTRFKNGELDILVATTVIEVGVDVPEATIMIVEHADRFGLSQLHQLRGRVGRNFRKSSCILIYGEFHGESAKRKLQILRETEDGFRIAEEDLLLRGSGEVLGTKQSGMPDFKFAVLPEHTNLIIAARDDVKSIMKDKKLESKRGEHLNTLLYLFEYGT